MPRKRFPEFRIRRDQKRVYVVEYLLQHPCVDCGETDLRVLEFDHRGDVPKRLGVGRLVSGGTWGLEAVIREIAKCDVRCANCHRKRTIGTPEWFAGFDDFKARVVAEASRRSLRRQRVTQHGTRRQYQCGCRCDLCRGAQREYMRKYRPSATHQQARSV